PGNTLGAVADGLNTRGYTRQANNAYCPFTINQVIDTTTWKAKGPSPCIFQIAVLQYATASTSTGRSTVPVVGFTSVFIRGLDGNTGTLDGVFVQAVGPANVTYFRNNGTLATRLIR